MARSTRTMVWLMGIVSVGWPAAGFDTGHHSDLTREAMRAGGFGDPAIKAVQVQNWLVDYYSSSPTSPAALKADLAKLHFDNLFSTGQVRNYWGRLTHNTRVAIQQAAREGDVLKFLTVLGVSFHAIQDFYSHSNWVESHPRPKGGAIVRKRGSHHLQRLVIPQSTQGHTRMTDNPTLRCMATTRGASTRTPM